MMTGKGRFVVEYEGQVLSGEATRVVEDEKRGVASAYSLGGIFMSCEYQLNTPYQGAGTCTFSNGAKYQMHIGGWRHDSDWRSAMLRRSRRSASDGKQSESRERGYFAELGVMPLLLDAHPRLGARVG